MADRKELEEELNRVNTLIDEAEERLGAHSVKPVLMQELLNLEERRDKILERINLLNHRGHRGHRE